MASRDRSGAARRYTWARLAWFVVRWLWFPVIVLFVAGEVHGSGVLVLLGFLGIGWAAQGLLAIHRAWRDLRRWPSLRAAASSVRVRALWPVVAADLGAVDGTGSLPHLVSVEPRPYGADLVLDVTGDSSAVRSLEDVRGALARWLGVPEVRVGVDQPGRVRIEARALNPLADSRPASPAVDAPGVVARLGRFEDGSDILVDLASPWHVACQGMTRSGKSVLTYGLLAAVAQRSDVVVGGLDPTGVLLGPWLGHSCPDLRALGTHEMTVAAAAVDGAVALMEARIAGLGYQDKLGMPTDADPLLLFVLEEYPGVLAAAQAEDASEGRKPAERVAGRIKRGVQRLVLEGAKVNVRVVLLAQRMDAEIVGGAERSSLGARVSLRVDNADALRMLHPTSGPDVVERMATATPGMAYVDLPGEPGRWAKLDLLDYQQYRAAVAANSQEEVPA